jgi:hypothetical protein
VIGPGVGVRREAVVDVQRDERDALIGRDVRGGVEERHRVASAGQCDGRAPTPRQRDGKRSRDRRTHGVRAGGPAVRRVSRG